MHHLHSPSPPLSCRYDQPQGQLCAVCAANDCRCGRIHGNTPYDNNQLCVPSATNGSRRVCHERSCFRFKRGAACELLVADCPHAHVELHHSRLLYPTNAEAHQRKRRCILPVDQAHWAELDSLFAPQVMHNLPQPANVGGAAWTQHDTHGLNVALRAFAPLMNPT